jgi:PKHD-type hydroxylase
MLHETDYWFWESAIPSNICNDIIKHGLSKQESKAFTGTADEPTPEETADKIRQSNVSWLNDRWIYNTLHPYVNAANKNAGWNFDWDWSENIQFTKYKLNQFYDWHQDAYDKVYPENYGSNQAGKIRKLSIIVTLVDGSEYDGGDLQMNFRHKHKIDEIKTINEIRPKGSVIVFPSYIFHRVTPVTRGTRYSLVNWNLGYPYR